MTKLTPEDPLPELVRETSTKIPDLDLYDTTDLNADRLKEIALDIENNSLEVKGINNSNGASTSQSKSSIYLATSEGFSNGYKKSNFSASCSVIAGSDSNMQTDYDFDSKVFFSDLKRPSEIGKKAAEIAMGTTNRQSIFYASPPQSIPFYDGNPWFLPIYQYYFAFKDWIKINR